MRKLVQFSSVAQSFWLFATKWTTARQASLSVTNSQSPPIPMSIESVIPSNHLILCHPLFLLPTIFPSIRVFLNESAPLHIRWPKYWSFSFNINPSNEHPGLISLQDGSLCSPRDSQESSPTPRIKSINSSLLSFFFFIVVDFVIHWNETAMGLHVFPLPDEWIRKLWYIHTMEYYSAIKKNSFESVLMRWMKLEPIIQGEVTQKDKDHYNILTHIYGI